MNNTNDLKVENNAAQIEESQTKVTHNYSSEIVHVLASDIVPESVDVSSQSEAPSVKKYEVTDELRRKYTDISIKIDTTHLLAIGYHPLLVDKLVEMLPFINTTVRDMSIIEAEYMVDDLGICAMFDGVSGMEEASGYIRHHAFKVAVEKNKDKVMNQIQERWNSMVEELDATRSDTPAI